MYRVQTIDIEQKADLERRYASCVQFEVKSEIYGCCIKLLTGDEEVKDRWEQSFYNMSQSVRSHGRLYVLSDPNQPADSVLYDHSSKTAFLLNFDYYGWIKSLGLSLAGDLLEDQHTIHSCHGACLDVDGRGVAILGGSGAGKTTHTYGLLRHPQVRAVSDDWFFGRIFGEVVLAYGSEKNFYIRSELSSVWKEFSGLVNGAWLDKQGRGVIDLRSAIGKGRMLPLTTLRTVIILKRDPGDLETLAKLGPKEALHILQDNGYYNPHLLVRDGFKDGIRRDFFSAVLRGANVYSVNTTGSPDESQALIRQVVGLEK
ncbi:MAG: hypothetical protein A4E47_00730 [Methanosaeta sp. PtaU1.Bin028]|nr:MAG: hypothetical protein A4E47_00730 [Methanosaeta sp. PtaU1.Bin028]